MKYLRTAFLGFVLLQLNISTFADDAGNHTENKALLEYTGNLINRFVSITKDKNLLEENMVAEARALLERNLDFNWMGKFVLGRYRRGMEKDKIEEFVVLYKKYLLTTYSESISLYNSEEIAVKSFYQVSDAEYVVKTAILRAGKEDIAVDYLVRESIENNVQRFKVFDVVTEGVSLINSQKTEFGSIIGSKGLSELEEFMLRRLSISTEKKPAA